MSKQGSVFGGVLLVAGTTIGGGILALPLSGSFAGTLPMILLLVMGWLYMMYTALLTLEVNLWVKDDSNFTSMIHKTLGAPMAVIAGVVYAFLLLCLLTAYMSNIGHLIVEAFDLPVHMLQGSWAVTVLLLVILAIFICLGTRVIDYTNRIFMGILICSFALLISIFPGHIDVAHYQHRDWSGTLIALSMVVLSYGYHIIIPSLVTYLNGDEAKIRRSLLIGSAIPLSFYILWVILVFGALPATGEWGVICFKSNSNSFLVLSNLF